MMNYMRMMPTAQQAYPFKSNKNMPFVQCSTRYFAKKNDDDYSKQFESMLGQTGTQLSEEEKAKIEASKKQKEQIDAEQQRLDDIERQRMAEQKQQDFDDLLKGKSANEKNLQTIFKEFYNTAKSIDAKEVSGQYVNKARSSLGSMSAKLEARRQKMRDMKANAMDIDKSSEDAKKDEAKDSAKK